MPKFDKPDSPNIIWGVNALDEDLTRPDDSYIQTGWTQVKPPYEYENYSMNKLYQGFAYYNQLGIPEWDSETEYQANKSYVQGSNNRVYKCIQTHVNKNPSSAGNEAWWELFEGNRQATESTRGTVRLASQSETDSGQDDTKTITPRSLRFGVSYKMESTGYITLPSWLGGLILQWGRSDFRNDGDGDDTITTVQLPVSFPNDVFTAHQTDSTVSGSTFSGSWNETSGPTSVLSFRTEDVGDGRFVWFAIGH